MLISKEKLLTGIRNIVEVLERNLKAKCKNIDLILVETILINGNPDLNYTHILFESELYILSFLLISNNKHFAIVEPTNNYSTNDLVDYLSIEKDSNKLTVKSNFSNFRDVTHLGLC